MLAVVGVNVSLAAGPDVTVKGELAPMSPVAVALMLPVAATVDVNEVVETPAVGVTGEAGVNAPVKPLAVKLTALVAEVTTLPKLSWIPALYRTAVPAAVEAVAAGVNTSLAAGPGVTVSDVVAPVKPTALALILPLPAVVEVNEVVATPELGATGEAGLKVPVRPLTANVTAFVAVVTVFPKLS